MRTLTHLITIGALAASLIGSLAIVGCDTDPNQKPDAAVEDSKVNPPVPTDTNTSDDGDKTDIPSPGDTGCEGCDDAGTGPVDPDTGPAIDPDAGHVDPDTGPAVNPDAGAPKPDTGPEPVPEAKWGSCEWVEVGAASHQAGPAWCPDGSYLVQVDLDGDKSYSEYDMPFVGRARCCELDVPGAESWDTCDWVAVGAQASHAKGAAWCPAGSFLTQVDLDSGKQYAATDSPYIGQARCCQPSSLAAAWSDEVWVEMNGAESHQQGPAWCPDGAFLTAFDLDGDTQYSGHDAPLVGRALCATPQL